jgi:hypothetical protein
MNARARSLGLAATAIVGIATIISSCGLIEDKSDAAACANAASVEWQEVQITQTTYTSTDSTIGYGHYPEGPTASQGSACFRIYEPITCQGETTHIINTYAKYASDTHIDGSGDLRLASITFDGDTVPIHQFNPAGSGTEGSTAHFNGDRTVPSSVTVISSYPLATAPADPTDGEQQCASHQRATFRIE